ncbi:MAG: biopolymer transporter ExbD [Archangiaceae bacterium]|nr:biopolymer transporter ExbD [Archangiaceae bacterium]
MAMGLGSGKGLKSEINVTPLVDVVLVLLIIFMVVTPLLQRGKDVTLPKATQVEGEGATNPLVVSVTVDKELWVENRRFDDDAFVAVVAQALKVAPGRRVLLKGDERLAFDDVRRVMRLAREAGAKSVALGVEAVAK